MLHTRPFAAFAGGLDGRLAPPGIGGGGGGPPIVGMGGGGGGGAGGGGISTGYRDTFGSMVRFMLLCFCKQGAIGRPHAPIQLEKHQLEVVNVLSVKHLYSDHELSSHEVRKARRANEVRYARG